MNRMARIVPGAVILMFLGLTSSTILAGQMLVDQQNQVALSASWSVMYLAPIGQEFVPANDSLDSVELFVSNLDPFSPDAADLVVNLRQGDILGSVVGTSLPVSIPFNASGVARFDFPAPVGLVPGNHYVLEIVIAAGTGNVAVGGGWAASYAPGRVILQGVPVPSTDNSDLWFREGIHRGARKRAALAASR